MATLRDIRNRIGSVEKMQKIVTAMKMIAAARLARASQAIVAARPYAQKLEEALRSVASGVESDAHPLLEPRESVRRLEIVLITSDRGLCGAFNSNLIRCAEELIALRGNAGSREPGEGQHCDQASGRGHGTSGHTSTGSCGD